MSKVVCIVTYKEITDEAKLAAYAAMAPATVEKYGGQFLARGYPVALRESGQQERTVVGIWESIDVALQWYESPEYKECLEGCCQTKEPKHQYSFGGFFYEVTNERHSVRAASRLSLNVLRFESDLCELNRL